MVPIHHLRSSGVKVSVRFAGNQEGAMGQLLTGAADVAGVNSEVMREFSTRNEFAYRVIWTSQPYLSMPVAAKRSVPNSTVEAVRKALIGMKEDREGRRVLMESARVVGQKEVRGFAHANDDQYKNQRILYQDVVSVNR